MAMRQKPTPKEFEVLAVRQVTPNMRNVAIGGVALHDFPTGQDGAYVKLMLPTSSFLGKKNIRTYTIRRQLHDRLDIEFALHGDNGEGGPAVHWAMNVEPGDKISIGGPGPAKPLLPDADWYIVVGDMTALPAIAVNLAALPDDARGDVVIEVQSEADKQLLVRPNGVNIHWVINDRPGENADLMENAVRAIEWPAGRVYAWSATEFETMRRMRTYLRDEKGLSKDELYISSYWKKGANEDAHRQVKRKDAMASS